MFGLKGLSEMEKIEQRWVLARGLALEQEQQENHAELARQIEQLKAIREELKQVRVEDPCVIRAKTRLDQTMGIFLDFFSESMTGRYSGKMYFTEAEENFKLYKQALADCKKIEGKEK